jgi:hypothetical protein
MGDKHNTGPGVHTAHAVYDDQKVIFSVIDIIPFTVHLIPAPHSADAFIKPRS